MEHYNSLPALSPLPIASVLLPVVGGVSPGLSTAHISPQSAPYLSPVQKQLNTVVITKYNLETAWQNGGPGITQISGLRDAVPVVRDYGQFTGYPGGNLISITAPYSSATGKATGGGLRGKIYTFTKAARRRLLRLLATVDKRSSLPMFVTLTYPKEYPHDWQTWKRHLDIFCKRLLRRYSGAGLVWRIEPQKRGAPHYHLLVWGIREVLVLRQWVASAWYEIAHNGDKWEGVAGTRVEDVRSGRGVMSYASKYLSKLPAGPPGDDWTEGIGRWWGMRAPQNIPWASRIVHRLLPQFVPNVMSAMLAHAGLSEGQWRRVTVYGDGDEWLEFVEKLIYQTGGQNA